MRQQRRAPLGGGKKTSNPLLIPVGVFLCLFCGLLTLQFTTYPAAVRSHPHGGQHTSMVLGHTDREILKIQQQLNSQDDDHGDDDDEGAGVAGNEDNNNADNVVKDGVMNEQEAQSVVSHAERNPGQSVHYIFTTDCSAYQFMQGNMLLASADALKVPASAFTWIVNDCTRKEQFDEFKKLGHPLAKAFFVTPNITMTDPDTGNVKKPFQASNRPVGLRDWWERESSKISEEAIVILDPDQMWMRPVQFDPSPSSAYDTIGRRQVGSWNIPAMRPGHGGGAYYSIGCMAHRMQKHFDVVCKGRVDKCEQAAKLTHAECDKQYSSGPPWAIHKSDAKTIFDSFIDTAIRFHNAWPDLLAEQGSWQLTEVMSGVTNELSNFWMISNPGDPHQPFKEVLAVDNYDPCESREVPDPSKHALPALFHSCSTYDVFGTTGFRLHKDHIHKDLLDCDAPLVRYAPKDSLQRMKKDGNERRIADAWMVCTYTNLVNTYAARYKKKFCENPNLDPSREYPPHKQMYSNENSRLKKIFRAGGWGDVDYKLGKS